MVKPGSSETLTWYIATVRQLIARLERISADSATAHRASGIRGDLWCWLEWLETWQAQQVPLPAGELETLSGAMNLALDILQAAAREIRDPDEA